MKNIFKVLPVAAIFLVTNWAFALNIEHFQPDHPVEKSLTQYGSVHLRGGDFSVGAVFDVSHQPLEFSDINGNRSDEIVDWFVSANTSLEFGITDYFNILVAVPMNIYSHVEGIDSTVVTKDGSLGDVRVTLPFTLYKDESVGVAIVPHVLFATGSEVDFFGDQSKWDGSYISSVGGDFAIDGQITKRDYVVMNFGSKFRKEEVLADSLIVNDEFLYGASYVHTFVEKEDVDLFVDVYGSTPFRDMFQTDITSPLELLVGARKRWENVALLAGGGSALNDGYGSPGWRAFVGLAFYNKHKDAPAAAPVIETPSTFTLQVQTFDEKYKPLPANIEIKQEGGNSIVQENTQAFSQNLTRGVYDISASKEGYNPVTAHIISSNQNEIRKNLVLRKIPEKVAEVVKRELATLNSIYFFSGKATLKPESIVELDKAIQIINNHPDIKNISIEAHTDSQGPEPFNLDLSYKRAKTVYEYFIAHGIAKEKLSYVGFGELQPIDTNETSEGRAKNRRIDFKIDQLKYDAKPLK